MLRPALAGLALALAGVAPSLAASKPVDGVWRSRGYGIVAEVKNGRATLYDTTTSFCLERQDSSDLAEALFTAPKLAPDGRSMTAKVPRALTVLQFDRITELPQTCTASASDSKNPVRNFDVFWETMNEQYAFFKERGIDWAAIRAEYRPQITDKTTDAEFVDIIRRILRQFQDLHVRFVAGDEQVMSGMPELFGRWVEEMKKVGLVGNLLGKRVSKQVEYLTPSWTRYLDANSVETLPSNVAVGTADKGAIAYAWIGSESGDFDDRAPAFEKIFAGFAGKRGLILDTRFNSGGSDEIAMALAELLTATARPGVAKCARNGDGFTPVQRTTLHPRAQAFTGPVVLLISPLNWSAGENLAMVLKDFPNIVVVGDHTAGVHSDTLKKFLPNGWQFTVSNEVFTAPDGTMYETVGVPPDLLLPFEPEQVKATGIDPQIEKALHLLRSDRFASLAAAAKRAPGKGRTSLCP